MLSRRNDCFKQRLFLISTWVIRFWIIYLVRVPCLDALFYVGTYHYQDFMAFVRSEKRCGFYPENVSSFIRRDHSIEKESCLIFMKSVINFSAISDVAKAKTNYFAFGAKYSFPLKASPCTNQLQDVEMVLFCEGQTVFSGLTCNQGCNRLSEVCRQSSDVNEELCIPERKIDDFCDNNLPCPRNSECKMVNNFTSCQCSEGFEALDGTCKKVGLTLGDTCDYNSQCSGTINASLCLHDRIRNKKVCSCENGYVADASNCILSGLPLNAECKEDLQCTETVNGHTCLHNDVRNQSICQCDKGYIEKNSSCFITNRRLYEYCDWSEQCTGSTEANECKAIDGIKMCYCSEDRGIFEGACLKVGLTLGEHCYVGGQCTGTSNSVCKADQDQTGSLTCQCSNGFMRHNGSCLKEFKRLYDECEIDAQCNRTSEEVVCKEKYQRKMCMCNTGYKYLEVNGTWKCLKEYKQLYDECEIDDQCNRTSEEVVCKEKYQRKMCMCNTGYKYLEVNGTWKCMKVGLTLGEPCYIHEQCTGTRPAVSCVSKENDAGVLTCQCNSTRGYLRYNDTCLQVDKQLYEECEIDVQCNGTSGKEVCTEIRGRKLCLCEVGFIEDKTAMECFQATMMEEQAWIADKRIQFLVIAVGGFVIITCLVCLFTTVMFALKKRKSDNQRFEYQDSTQIEIGHIHNSPNDDTGNIYDEDVSQAHDHNSVYDHTDDIYNVTHQREEQKDENFYNHIETQSSFSEQHSDHYTHSYNHLHQRPFPMSLVYNEPNTTSV
uniref:EGF-like domain-containing protein n=1 Tax=Magallana gigas TaxID=29159 RepID=A0A8W8LZE3_MAGGI|nr:prion-like-(Q/N-rich) domain-bearing protein 25 isoform X1 [Crassostrea gigas]